MNTENNTPSLNDFSLRDSFLTSDDEVGSSILEDDPGGGLNPQPVSCFGQQPEEGEATVSGLYH